MKLVRTLVPIILVGLTLSCGDTPTGISENSHPGADEGIQVSTALSVKQYNAAEVEWRPFSFTVEGCAEDVDVTGRSHNLKKDQIRGTNGPTSFLMVSAQGFGVGQESQAKYVFSDKITYSSGGEIGEGTFVGTSRQFSLIGQGKVPDLHFYGVVKIIFDGAGNVTFQVDEAHQTCK